MVDSTSPSAIRTKVNLKTEIRVKHLPGNFCDLQTPEICDQIKQAFVTGKVIERFVFIRLLLDILSRYFLRMTANYQYVFHHNIITFNVQIDFRYFNDRLFLYS